MINVYLLELHDYIIRSHAYFNACITRPSYKQAFVMTSSHGAMYRSPRPVWTHQTLSLLLWCLTGISFAQKDPIKNFCRRWGHQSAVVDRKLYIDGGLINYQGAADNLSSRFLSLAMG